MWIFTRYGFYSIAAGSPAGAAESVMIRARCRSHLENLQTRFGSLSAAKIEDWRNCDYRFRIIAEKDVWVAVAAELAREQAWSNFKNEAAKNLPRDRAYQHALHEVWRVMYELQQDPGR